MESMETSKQAERAKIIRRKLRVRATMDKALRYFYESMSKRKNGHA